MTGLGLRPPVTTLPVTTDSGPFVHVGCPQVAGLSTARVGTTLTVGGLPYAGNRGPEAAPDRAHSERGTCGETPFTAALASVWPIAGACLKRFAPQMTVTGPVVATCTPSPRAVGVSQ